jgi:hypothetical protein
MLRSPLVVDEPVLRERARQKMRRGTLPSDSEARVWAGPGLGLPCDVCDQPIERDDLEYELEFATDPARPPQAYRFHRRCHAAWQLERTSTRNPGGATEAD